MRLLILAHVFALSVFALCSPIQLFAADDGVLDTIQISMPNGELPDYTSPGGLEQVEHLRQMVARMQSSPAYYLGVIGTFSKAPWKGSTRKVSIALNGGISANRGGNVIAKLLKDCGLSESEMVSRVRYEPLSGETETKQEPFIRVSLVEDRVLRDFFIEIRQEVSKRRSLIAGLILPIVQGRLTTLSEKRRAELQDLVDAANSEEDAKILVFSPTPEATNTAKSLLADMGLQKPPVFKSHGVQRQINPMDESVAIFLVRDLRGDLASLPPPEVPPETSPPGSGHGEPGPPGNHTRVSLVVGASANWSGNWNRHLTPGIDGYNGTERTNLFPTADIGVTFNNRAAVFCKLQFPGSVFENEGGDVNLSEIKVIVRAFGPICASVSREQYVSRHTDRHASVPNYVLVFPEKAPGWALGLHANLNHRAPGKGVGVGANVMFVDREYQVPRGPRAPAWKIEEPGDVQAHVYVSYGVSLISFGGRK